MGKVVWYDLTVENATEVKTFYEKVVGWTSKDCNMGNYNDFEMQNNGETITGICHQQGVNKNIPSQWLLYVEVENLAESIATAEEMGGEIIDGPRKMNGKDFCVLKDPVGAIIGLIEK